MNAEYHTLEQKFERLKEQVLHLGKIKNRIKSPDDLEKDPDSEALAERFFQIALEVVLDIGRMIISMENLPRPQENDEIFKILAKANIITDDFAKRAFGMGRFRNILVHGYMIIDVKRVYENLQKLDLFEEYLKFIVEYLKKSKKREENLTKL